MNPSNDIIVSPDVTRDRPSTVYNFLVSSNHRILNQDSCSRQINQNNDGLYTFGDRDFNFNFNGNANSSIIINSSSNNSDDKTDANTISPPQLCQRGLNGKGMFDQIDSASSFFSAGSSDENEDFPSEKAKRTLSFPQSTSTPTYDCKTIKHVTNTNVKNRSFSTCSAMSTSQKLNNNNNECSFCHASMRKPMFVKESGIHPRKEYCSVSCFKKASSH